MAQHTNRPLDDPTAPEGWEQLRRSIAMLPTGAWALKREQALQVLSALLTSTRGQRDQSS